MKQQEKPNRPICSECNIPMGKSGMGWSGRRKVQRYHCSSCGKVIHDTGKKQGLDK